MADPLKWKTLIPGCFANLDAPFGIHPCDHERAVRMFHHALNVGATLDGIVEEARDYLESRGSKQQSVERQLKLIRSFRPNPTYNRKSSRIWLLTWESSKAEPRIHTVLSARRSHTTVRAYVEQAYIDQFCSLHEKLIYAKNRKNNIYPAEFHRIDGVPFVGRITCGDDPFLLARLVREFRVSGDKPEQQTATWIEEPVPKRFPAHRR